ncbi:hypothetical protein OF83DRAFT_1055737, partial [Amylostereum chailletii]
IHGIFSSRSLRILADSPLASVHQATMMIQSTLTKYRISSSTILSRLTADFCSFVTLYVLMR